MPTNNPWRGISIEQRDITPFVTGGMPLWAASPEQALAPRLSKDDDALLSLALINRYKTPDIRFAGDMLARDFGLGNYKIPTSFQNPGLNVQGQERLGTYEPDRGAITINPTTVKNYRDLPTLAHEIGHAADDIRGGPYEGPENGKQANTSPAWHHKFFERLEPEMALNIEAQRAIENGRGGLVSGDTMDRYPYLKKVTPYASQPLANPWAGLAPREEPFIWNAQRGR